MIQQQRATSKLIHIKRVPFITVNVETQTYGKK